MRLLPLAGLLILTACNRYEMGNCDPQAFQPRPEGGSAIAWIPIADAEVSGRVVDMAGRPIREAVVDLPGFAANAVTNDRGEFRVRRLQAGVKEARVRAIGYAPAIVSLQLLDGAKVDAPGIERREGAELLRDEQR